MWPEIESVSLVEEMPPELHNLPCTLERFEASRFFSGYTPGEWSIIEVDQARNRRVKSWLCWASLVAFASIRDTVREDLEESGLYPTWRASRERQLAYEDPLLAVLFELRNFQVHFEFHSIDLKEFSPLIGYAAKPDRPPEQANLGEAAFISEVDYRSIAKLRNVRSGKSPVTREMLTWFNQQANAWPAAYLVGEGRVRFMQHIASFVRQQHS